MAKNELFRLNYLQEFFINKIIANKDNDQEIYLQINKIISFYVSHIQKKIDSQIKSICFALNVIKNANAILNQQQQPQ